MAKLTNTAVAELNISKVGTVEGVDFDMEGNVAIYFITADNAYVEIREVIDWGTDDFDSLSLEITYTSDEEDNITVFSDSAEQLVDRAIEWMEENNISRNQEITDSLVAEHKERMIDV